MSPEVTKEELLAKARKPAEDAMRLHPFYQEKMIRQSREATTLLMKSGLIPPAPEG